MQIALNDRPLHTDTHTYRYIHTLCCMNITHQSVDPVLWINIPMFRRGLGVAEPVSSGGGGGMDHPDSTIRRTGPIGTGKVSCRMRMSCSGRTLTLGTAGHVGRRVRPYLVKTYEYWTKACCIVDGSKANFTWLMFTRRCYWRLSLHHQPVQSQANEASLCINRLEHNGQRRD